MATVTKAERELRVQQALKLLATGHSFTSTVSQCAVNWGVCREAARRYVRTAMATFKADCEVINSSELLAETLHRLQEVARKAEESGQYSAAVGAIKALAELTGLGGEKSNRGSYK
jgi:hypothetical protein